MEAHTTNSSSHLHEVLFADRNYPNKLLQIKDFLSYLERTPRVSNQNFFMLIRPRGFGISLALDAMESLLLHDEVAYEYLEDRVKELDQASEKQISLGEFDVLRLSFTRIKAADYAEYYQELLNNLRRQVWEHHIKIKNEFASDVRTLLFMLIKEIAKRNKQQLVILIDNYDLPIQSLLYMPEEKDRELSIDLYFDMLNTIRKCGDCVRFCLLTGHSKFALANSRSEGIAHVIDLSFSEIASTMLGLTKDELMQYYGEDIKRVAPRHGITVSEYIDSLEQCYGGYVFSDSMNKVICPDSIVRALENDGALYAYACNRDYSFVQDLYDEYEPDLNWLFNKDGQDQLLLEEVGLRTKSKAFGSLLVQMGFATVNKVTFSEEEHSMSWRYRFGIPNVEMRRCFNILTGKYSPELKELAINPRVYTAGEDQYLITEEEE